MANVRLGAKAVGSTVKIKVNGTVKDFIIVHQGKPSSVYDDSCNGTWVLMKDIYTTYTFGNNNSYKDSSIHTYLNGTFYNLIDSDIRAAIKQVKIPYQNGTGGGDGALPPAQMVFPPKYSCCPAMKLAGRPATIAISPRMVSGWRTLEAALAATASVSPTTAAALPCGGCALRTPTITAASGPSTPRAPTTPAAGTTTPVVFAPL